MKRPFLVISAFEVNKALLSQMTLYPRYAKNVITNAHYGATTLSCLFPKSWWNFNVVKIVRIFYSLFSTKYIAFLYYWSTWLKANVENIKTNYVIHRMWRESRWPLSMTRPKFPLAQMRYHATYIVKPYAACKNLTWNLIETERLTLYYDSVEKLGLLAYFQCISFFLRPQSHFRIEWQRSLYTRRCQSMVSDRLIAINTINNNQ